MLLFNNSWHEIEIQSNLETPAIDSTAWFYPWYVIKHRDGHFENTLGESISKTDTAHLVQNTSCEINYQWADKQYVYPLKQATAKQKDDTLFISIIDESASNYECLEIKILDGKFRLNYDKIYVIPTQRQEVLCLSQRLILNQGRYEVGERIKGKIEAEFMEILQFDEGEVNSVDTIYKSVQGTFEVVI